MYFVVGFSERLAKDIVERTEGLITQKKEVEESITVVQGAVVPGIGKQIALSESKKEMTETTTQSQLTTPNEPTKAPTGSSQPNDSPPPTQ